MKDRRLFLLPIEPLAERYTEVWFRWLPETFSKGFDVQCIDGETLTDSVETGAFLDLHSTLHYKASQLQKVARLFRSREVRNGDAFFIADIEFWGMESIRYLATLSGLDGVKIYGFLHAASYTRGDFMSAMEDLGRHVEIAWIKSCDKVFVGSEYHRRAVIERRLANDDWKSQLARRIVVTGNPWRTSEAEALERGSRETILHRDIDVVFPHRPDAEKRPGRFLEMLEDLPSARVAFTTGRKDYRSCNDSDHAGAILSLSYAEPDRISVLTGLDRTGFYRVLRRSKVVVSTALEENFGYAIVEAMAMGALPMLPRVASYPELVMGDSRFLYEADASAPEVAYRIQTLLSSPEWWREDVHRYAQRFDISEQRILAEML